VELEHVCVDAGGERVLDEVSLRVGRGDFVGIIGPNGAGKTTLLRVLVGLVRPTCGHVRLFGTDLRAFRQWHRIGYVPQQGFAVDARFPATVLEVALSGRTGLRGVGRPWSPADREAAVHALEVVGVGDLRDRPIGRLSAGQFQRVLIARALASRPDLLLLDEPTVGVDRDAQDQFYALLRRLNREMGTTLILVSHDVSVVAGEVTHLACLNRRLVFHGPPQEAVASGALTALYRADSLVVAHRH
jgi:zinc transport system ATP-binding protein